MPDVLEKPKHRLSIMDGTGDTRIEWDSDNETEVAVARDAFTRLKKDGYLLYAVDADGEQEVAHEFNPMASAIVATPPLVGG